MNKKNSKRTNTINMEYDPKTDSYSKRQFNAAGLKGFFSDAWNKTKGVGKNTLNYVKAHPGMSAALGIGGAANIGGLFDNNKIGGQILGATGAGLGAHFIPKLLGKTPLGIPVQVAIGLGGGTIGALFDRLRAKREQEQQAAQQYYGGY